MDKDNAIEVKILKYIMIKEANLRKKCFSGSATDMRKDMFLMV